MTDVSRVSVIIPLYNRADYIVEAVESVLNQTQAVHELLVVDDGSTDGGAALLEHRPGVTVLRHEGGVNKGQAASINLGLSHVSGDVIAILDSDDYWAPTFVESLLARMNEADAPDLVYADGWAVDAHGTTLYRLFPKAHAERNQPGSLLVDCYVPSPGCYLCRRSLYDQVGVLDESLRAAQDHDMLIRLAEKGRLTFVQSPLFFYRKHGDSISANGQERRWRNGFVILAKAVARYPYPATIVRQRKAVLNFRMGQFCWSQRRYVRAFVHFMAAALLDMPRVVRIVRGREKIR